MKFIRKITLYAILIASLSYWDALSASNPLQNITQSRENAITRAVESVSNSVVGINVIQVKEYQRRYYGEDQFFQFFSPTHPFANRLKALVPVSLLIGMVMLLRMNML